MKMNWVLIKMVTGDVFVTPRETFENWSNYPLPAKLQNNMDLYIVVDPASDVLKIRQFDGWINFQAVCSVVQISDKVEICPSMNTVAKDAS